MERCLFPIRKGGIFRTGKEIEGLRGGVLGYRLAERRELGCATAEGSGQVGRRSHRPRAEKDPFRMETILSVTISAGIGGGRNENCYSNGCMASASKRRGYEIRAHCSRDRANGARSVLYHARYVQNNSLSYISADKTCVESSQKSGRDS